MIEHLFDLPLPDGGTVEWSQESPRSRTLLTSWHETARVDLPWVQYATYRHKSYCAPALYVFASLHPVCSPATPLRRLLLPHFGMDGGVCMGTAVVSVLRGAHSPVEALWMSRFSAPIASGLVATGIVLLGTLGGQRIVSPTPVGLSQYLVRETQGVA